jgi:glycosyltransferase involved in cell wall biosynthesis
VPQDAREWLSFPFDDDAVRAIAARVRAWLQASDEVRAATRAALVATARERFSWEVVAGGVVAAAEGRLSELPPVA